MVTSKQGRVRRRRGGRRPAGGVYDAIADPTRRQIVERLAGGGMSVEALASGFSVSRPAISKHLRVLHEARLVRVTVQGRRHLYELEPEPLGVVDAWLTRVRMSLAARLMELKLSVEETTGDQP